MKEVNQGDPPALPRRVSSRTFVRLAIGLMSLPILLVVGFYVIENWRGEKAWKKYQAERKAAGDSLDFADYIPEQVPDMVNFANTPLIKAALEVEMTPLGPRYLDPEGMDRVRSLRLNRRAEDIPLLRAISGAWQVAEPVNLVAWRWYFRGEPERMPKVNVVTNEYDGMLAARRKRDDAIEFAMTAEPDTPARDVLYALSKFGTDLRGIALDLQRPRCRYPLDYAAADGSIPMLHLSVLKRLCLVFRLRGVALLADGNTDRALDDLLTGYDLAQTLNEPFTMAVMVQNAMIDTHHQVLWEGLRERKWSGEQLDLIRQRLEKIQLIPAMRRGLAVDRIILGNSMLKRDLDYWVSIGRFVGWKPNVALMLAPKGWVRFNQVELNRSLDEIIAAMDAERPLIDLPQAETYGARALANPVMSNYIICKVPPQAWVSWVKTLRAQMYVHMAMAACELERHWQKHGEYPKTLAKPIKDLATGQSLSYRRSEDGRFLLYSLGHDGVDHGGKPATKWSDTDGDWVWRYSPAQ